MKKKLLILFFAIIIGGGIWIFTSQNKDKNEINTKTGQSNYQAERSSTKQETEKEVSTFSTQIHNKDKERQNNIEITCNTLNGTQIKPGEIFSFCDVVGKATTEKGYQEADIFVDGKKEKGLGGGNCQVSTTLYNAVLQVTDLEVTERHEHSKKVPYIEQGKDAAVSYGSYDFKFKNNSNYTIKIVMEKTQDEITAKLMQMQ